MVKLVLAVCVIWLAWRCFVFIWNRFRPVRNVANKAATNTLETAGHRNLAKNYSGLNEQFEKGVDANTNISLMRVLTWVAVLVVVFVIVFWSFSTG